MSSFKSIPIHLELADQNDGMNAVKGALLTLHEMVGNWLDTGAEGMIDLRQLPRLSAEAYQFLKDELGVGEVSAIVDSRGVGRSEVRETAYPGIWWLTHRNGKDEIVTELIEISTVPAVLCSQVDDVRSGHAKMTVRLQASG